MNKEIQIKRLKRKLANAEVKEESEKKIQKIKKKIAECESDAHTLGLITAKVAQMNEVDRASGKDGHESSDDESSAHESSEHKLEPAKYESSEHQLEPAI
jgi:hypothetical protein